MFSRIPHWIWFEHFHSNGSVLDLLQELCWSSLSLEGKNGGSHRDSRLRVRKSSCKDFRDVPFLQFSQDVSTNCFGRGLQASIHVFGLDVNEVLRPQITTREASHQNNRPRISRKFAPAPSNLAWCSHTAWKLEWQLSAWSFKSLKFACREALQPCLFASSNMVLITLKNRWNIALLKLSKSSSQDTSYPITKLQTLDFKPEFSVTCCSFVGPDAYPKQNPKQLPTNVYSLQCVHLLTCSLSAFVAVQVERRWVEISSGKIISTCMWSSSEGPPTVIWARAKLRKFQDCRRKYDFFHAAEVVLVWSEH